MRKPIQVPRSPRLFRAVRGTRGGCRSNGRYLLRSSSPWPRAATRRTSLFDVGRRRGAQAGGRKQADGWSSIGRMCGTRAARSGRDAISTAGQLRGLAQRGTAPADGRNRGVADQLGAYVGENIRLAATPLGALLPQLTLMAGGCSSVLPPLSPRLRDWPHYVAAKGALEALAEWLRRRNRLRSVVLGAEAFRPTSPTRRAADRSCRAKRVGAPGCVTVGQDGPSGLRCSNRRRR